MKIIIFGNDEDFEDYVLKPGYVFHESKISIGMIYYDVDYTDLYKKDIEDGVQFCIDLKESKVRKHNCIPRGMIMKKVENIIPFYIDEDELRLMYPKATIVNYKRADDMNSAVEDKMPKPAKTHKGKLKIRPVKIDKSGNIIPIDNNRLVTKDLFFSNIRCYRLIVSSTYS